MHAIRRGSRSVLLSGLVCGVLFVPRASAEPIRYITRGDVPYYGLPTAAASVVGPQVVRFVGTEGTLGGAGLHLGRFVVDVPKSGESTVYNNTPFAIEVSTPQFNRVIPPASPAELRTETDNRVIVLGHLSGKVGEGGHGLVATLDSVQLGGLNMYTLDHFHKYEFPIPLADLIRPGTQIPVGVCGASVDTHQPVAQVLPQPAPEPSVAVVLAAGLVAAGLHGRAARQRAAIPS